LGYVEHALQLFSSATAIKFVSSYTAHQAIPISAITIYRMEHVSGRDFEQIEKKFASRIYVLYVHVTWEFIKTNKNETNVEMLSDLFVAGSHHYYGCRRHHNRHVRL
jgi:hypothetical protein